MMSRRSFVGAAAGFVSVAALSGRAQSASIPEAHYATSAATQPPLPPSNGPEYRPVVTLNGWSLPWRMNEGVKEFHLVTEAVVREFAPGMKVHLWGYNGQSPGPTIEAVEGEKIRIFVTNKLPEPTSIHWHGILLPNGMDGVAGVTQPHIPPGKTFVYEFELKTSGTFMYHTHSDEMVQMAMGLMGMIVVHPRDPEQHRVDRDFAFMLATYDVDPGTYVPKVVEMTNFNMWTFNNRVFPGIDPLVVRLNDRVRVRMANLSMTNHPIHLHGHHFVVTGTDGGWIPRSAQMPESTVDVPVGTIRAFELVANNPGDWALHCHKSHHTMNAMGHDLRTFIGVKQSPRIVEAITKLVPDYMPMGSSGMGEMGAMHMPGPNNALPMMTGTGQFGPIEMGGMFTLMKIREGLARDDYKDPGPYEFPEGTVAHEVQGRPKDAPRDDGVKKTKSPKAQPSKHDQHEHH